MEKFEPKNGDQVWIKVFSNWSSGTYIGLDADGKNHLVREPKEGGYHIFSSTQILPITENPNGPPIPIMQKVKAVQDDSDRWYVLPIDLANDFWIDLESEDFVDSGEFDTKYSKYMTGGSLNLVQLYAEI
jgi:hypothetical protein